MKKRNVFKIFMLMEKRNEGERERGKVMEKQNVLKKH